VVGRGWAGAGGREREKGRQRARGRVGEWESESESESESEKEGASVREGGFTCGGEREGGADPTPRLSRRRDCDSEVAGGDTQSHRHPHPFSRTLSLPCPLPPATTSRPLRRLLLGGRPANPLCQGIYSQAQPQCKGIASHAVAYQTRASTGPAPWASARVRSYQSFYECSVQPTTPICPAPWASTHRVSPFCSAFRPGCCHPLPHPPTPPPPTPGHRYALGTADGPIQHLSKGGVATCWGRDHLHNG
jgi:hypothetical protein